MLLIEQANGGVEQQVVAKKRLTLAEAVQNLIDNSELKRCVDTGEFRRWPEASERDIASVVALISSLERDLNRFLAIRGRTIRIDKAFRLNVNLETTGQTDAERCAAFYGSLAFGCQWHIKQQLWTIWGHELWNTNGRLGKPFPMSSIRREGDIARFAWGDTPDEFRRLTMVRVAYVDPHDFPRHMPSICGKILEIADTTELDWKPRVMDGVLVTETIAAKDPALIIQTGMNTDIVVHYWDEPKNDADKAALEFNAWKPFSLSHARPAISSEERYAIRFTIVCAVIAAVAKILQVVCS